ncbi:MAG: N-acetylmuramoyl-L-alanine amidase, partial [Anaerolineae bacterium]|nr:N-acetylmuramoyl-L-alanine amidase [Anaerolineae bacterium]
MLVPDRRTVLVLASLVGAMTFGAGLLLLLEPGPVIPTTNISLNTVDVPRSAEQVLFETDAQLNNWSAIVIHASGAPEGSAAAIDNVHRKLGLGGLGYHFVIHNGYGGSDGRIVMSDRWHSQTAGAYCAGPDADWFNSHAVGICLVGDFDLA